MKDGRRAEVHLACGRLYGQDGLMADQWQPSAAFEVWFQQLTNDNEPVFAVTRCQINDSNVFLVISLFLGVAFAL